jgi:hypothetical protein
MNISEEKILESHFAAFALRVPATEWPAAGFVD